MSLYDDYQKALMEIFGTNPDMKMKQRLLPHLSKEQISELQPKTIVASPPLCVPYMIHQILLYGDSWFDLGPVTVPDMSPTIAYQKEATAFAQDNWNNKLVEAKPTMSCLVIILYDTYDMKEVGTAYCLLDNNYKEIQMDKSAPFSVLINEAILKITDDEILAEEIIKSTVNAVGMTHRNCMFCGGGLSQCACYVCGNREIKRNNDNATPLPSKVCDFFRGKVHAAFQWNLSLAQAEEKERWLDSKEGSL